MNSRLLLPLLLSTLAGRETKQSAEDGFDRYIVHTHEGMGIEQLAEHIRSMGGRIRKHLSLIGAIACELPESRIGTLAATETIGTVERDIKIYAQGLWGRRQKASGQEEGWGFRRIQAAQAWDFSRGEGTEVCVIDTGIAASHPDLRRRVVAGTNTINPRASYKDDNGHGTLVAGIIAARDNRSGVVGVAPSARLSAVKALDENGEGSLSDVIEGIEWAVSRQVGVINMSLGAPASTEGFAKAVEAARKAGIVMVAAAGNDGPDEDTVLYPAAFTGVVAVGALNLDDGIADFSSRGPQVDLVAPGVDIRSCWPPRSYREASGTSLAAPFASGTAALIRSAYPDKDADWVIARMIRSSIELQGVPRYAQGHGLLSAGMALLK